MPLEGPVLVTGATGFIGSHLVNALLAAGVPTRALVRNEGAAEALARRGVTPVAGDLDDPKSLTGLGDGVRVVFHCAAKVNQNLVGDEAHAYEANATGTRNLVAALSDGNGRGALVRFVHVSSIAAIGIRPHGRIDESQPEDPDLPYGKSKLAADRLLRRAHAESALPVVMLRPPTVYGPGERYNFLSLCRAIQSGKFARIGRGTNRMDFCAVENLVSAMIAAAERGTNGATYLIADQPSKPFRETIEILYRIVRRRGRPRWFVPTPVAYALAYPMGALGTALGKPVPLYPTRVRTMAGDLAFDCGKAERELAWRAGVRFEDAARETVAWYKSEGLLS
jgi:UDP-glucose 4-epimerase